VMSPRRVLYLVIWCVLFIIFFISYKNSVIAAGPVISVTTSPVSLDLPLQPGTSATRTLQLKNNGTQPLQITMKLEVFGPHGQNGEAAISQPSPNDPSPSWVHFSPSSFIAQPGIWSSVQMTIQLPKSASLGYYYAVIFKPTIPNQPSSSLATNTIKGSNAILVLVDTGSANESRQIQIANFSASKRVYEYLPAEFSVTIHNEGNIYLAPTGSIFISRNSNPTHSIASININASEANVLPHSNRIFKATWSDGFPVFQPKLLDGQPVVTAKGQPVEQLVWDYSHVKGFRIGKYYAQLTLVFSNNGKVIPLTGQVSFWVIPWKLLIVGIVISVLLLIGLWVVCRSILKKVKRLRKK
jgi:hypothetical protein